MGGTSPGANQLWVAAPAASAALQIVRSRRIGVADDRELRFAVAVAETARHGAPQTARGPRGEGAPSRLQGFEARGVTEACTLWTVAPGSVSVSISALVDTGLPPNDDYGSGWPCVAPCPEGKGGFGHNG